MDRAGWSGARISRFVSDASFRRYFRVCDGERRAVLMHAPYPSERAEPFLAVAKFISEQGLSAPDIFAAELEHGLILLEDLGDELYPLAITAGRPERLLYQAATDVLLHLHAAPMPAEVGGVPIEPYDDARLLREAMFLLDWHWPVLSGGEADADLRGSFASAWEDVLGLAQYDDDRLVQLDYHSPNLIWLPGREGARRVGILDFQDAMRGPAAYDLVSLLQDPRRDVPQALEAELVAHYLRARPDLDEAAFRASYAVMGAQRMTRILGVFVRLWRRDSKPNYLRHVPRAWRLLDRNLAHPALTPLKGWFDAHLPVSARRELEAEAA